MTCLRVALVGCGIISEAHVRAWGRHSDRARITVCCDLNEESARSRADEVEGARVVTDLTQVLADPDVDAVDICTPHPFHPEAVIAAANAGKHILCQKPLAKSLAECDAMIAGAKDAGVTLFYAESNHTMPAAREALRQVEAGRIGQLVGLQAVYAHWQGGKYMETAWRYDPSITGGGALLDGGIHWVDMLRQVGGPIEAVSCFTRRVRPELGGEDTSTVNFLYEAGHIGQLFSSQAVGIWYPGPGFAVFGTEGVLTIGGLFGGLVVHDPHHPDRRETLLDQGSWGDSFGIMIGHYLDAALDGAPNLSPGEVGREDLRIVLAAYRSAELGRTVRLSELDEEEAVAEAG